MPPWVSLGPGPLLELGVAAQNTISRAPRAVARPTL